ncbi:hypothetical protein D3C80_1151610 [compost metagenome]
MLLDHFRVVAAQPLAADREAAEALAFFDAGLLQQGQGRTAGTEEDEAGEQIATAATELVVDDQTPTTVGLAAHVGDLLVVGDLGVVGLLQMLQELLGQRAEVDVGTAHGASRGQRLVAGAALHQQRRPVTDGAAILAVLHVVAEAVMCLQGIEALAQEGHAFLAAHEAHVRNGIDEVLGRFEVALLDQIRPELPGDFEHRVDAHGLGDVDRAVGTFRGIVQFTECGVAGTRVVPREGTLGSPGVQLLQNFDLQARVELFQQYRQGCAHDACPDEYQIRLFTTSLHHSCS